MVAVVSSIHGLALLALAQLPQADSVARPQLDSAWCTALIGELPDTATADTVPLWVLVDRWGRVDSARVDSSAALGESRESRLVREARRLRFLPWEEGPGWTLVRYPIPSRDSVETEAVRPVFTPYTVRPEIKNRRRARDVVMRHYPGHLRDAKVSGRTTVSVFIDTTGAVTNVVTSQTSGSRELDESAERAVMEFEFTPALNRGRLVPVWVNLPISFEVTGGRASEPPPREFTLGPRHDLVAEAALMDPDELDALPELILPDKVRERLTGLYLDSSPAEDLGLVVTLQVGPDGAVQTRRITERLGGAAGDESTVIALFTELSRLRFRPGMVDGEPLRTTISVRLVFSRVVGLAPSPPRFGAAPPVPLLAPSGCAGADSVLLSGPQFSPLDEPPRPVTPEWERERLISDTWPIHLQREQRSYELQFWLLLDTAGRVCTAELLNEPEDPWVAGKARQIARRLRFKPGSLDNQPVAAWYNQGLAFSFVRE
jgi:TonB family protein